MLPLLTMVWDEQALTTFGAAVNRQIKAHPYSPFLRTIDVDQRAMSKSNRIPDVKTVVKLLDNPEALGIDKAKLVMNRGFYSKANADALLGRYLKFLIGMRTCIKLVRTTLLTHMEELRYFHNYDDNNGMYGLSVMTEWPYERVRPYK